MAFLAASLGQLVSVATCTCSHSYTLSYELSDARNFGQI